VLAGLERVRGERERRVKDRRRKVVIDKQLEVYRAQDTAGREVESVMLIIGQPIPDGRSGETSLDDLRKTFVSDAETVFQALKSLPGGTLDALLVRMLDTKSSHHVVQWDSGRSDNRAPLLRSANRRRRP
jgi:hypothetical protein